MSGDGSGDALLGGVMMFVGGFAAYRERRRILDTPTATANSAAIGRAELCGVARGDPPEISPITGTACAYWEANLWEYRANNNSKWGFVAGEKSKARHFWLEDKSGRIPILLHQATWTLENEFCAEEGEPPPDAAHEFLARHQRDWKSQRLRIKERRLEEGKALYVLGTLAEAHNVAQTLIDPRRSSRYGRIVSLMGAAGQKAAMQQTYRKGLDAMEILGGERTDAARNALFSVTKGEAALASLDPAQFLPPWLKPYDVVIWRGARRDPFRIANCAEVKVTKNLARAAKIGVIGGSALILFGIATL